MSYSLRLSKEAKLELDSRMSATKDHRIYKRLMAVKLKTKRMKHYEIASILNINPATVTDWFKQYIDGGLDRLCHIDKPGKDSSLMHLKKEITEYLDSNYVDSAVQIKDYLESEHNLCLTVETIRHFIKNELGYSFKKRV